MSKGQLTSLLAIPMVNGSISFIASFTIITCIFRSNLKLSTTYRRLIFGLSSFDLIQSLGQGLASVPMPKGSDVYFAAGNDITCNYQAFATVLATSGAMWYSLSLAIYFLVVIKYNLPDDVIRKRYEPFLHSLPITYSLGSSIYTYATENFGASGSICWIAYHPKGCENDTYVDCVNKGPVSTGALKWIVGGVPFFTVFVVNCVLLGIIWSTVRSQMKQNQVYRHSWIQRTSSHSNNNNQQQQKKTNGNNCNYQGGGICSKLTSCCSMCTNYKNTESTAAAAPGPLAIRLSRPSRAGARILQETSNRAIAYIIGYLLTYFFTAVYRITDLWTTTPFPIVLLSRFFFPLQGFFNVIIYTYPHVESCRRRNEEYSWIRAFFHVVKSGGDSDEARTGRATRRDSIRKQQKLLEQRGQLFNGTVNAKSIKKDSSKLVKDKQKEAQNILLHRANMNETGLDNKSLSFCTEPSKIYAEIGSNQSILLNFDSHSSHQLNPSVGNFYQDDDIIGNDVALGPSLSMAQTGSVTEFLDGLSVVNRSRIEDCETGSSNSYNFRKDHKKKEEEEGKREIDADEERYH